MKFTEFATLVRSKTGTNTTTFTDSNILLLANIYKDDIASTIVTKVGENYFLLNFEKDLVAGQREYKFPEEMMSKMLYIQAKLDGSTWSLLKESSMSKFDKPLTESWIQSEYAGREPEFILWGKIFYILSEEAIIDVTDGLKMSAVVYPANFTDLSSTEDMSNNPTDYTLGFPRQFHELLARRVSIAYKSSQDRPIPLSEKEQMYEVDLERQIQTLRGANLTRSFVPSSPSYDGSNY